MAKKKKNKNNRSSGSANSVALCSLQNFDLLCGEGYIPLSQTPEIVAAVNKIANLVGSMTIHLMTNTSKGDQRIKNELSRKIDINPNEFMTRNTFIRAVTRELLL